MIFLKTLERREKGIEPFTRTNLKNILSPVELKNIINDFRQDFIDAMDDDFNSPQAVGALFEIITASNKILCDRGFTEAHLEPLSYARDVVLELGGILGLDFSPLKPALAEDEIDKLISLRQDLKNQKKFDEADRIKKELLEKNIVLEDIKGGKTLWRVKV